MTDAAPFLDLGRHRDLEGRTAQPWMRRAVLLLFALVVIAALAGVMGQRAASDVARTDAAQLRVVSAPTLRGGLLWPARIEITAQRDIAYPRLVLAPGWVRGMQLNTLEPSPQGETTRGDDLVLSYGRLSAGDRLVIYLQAQVDPTTVGRQDVTVTLDDRTRQLVSLPRRLTVLP
jgi:hypothetical protein